MSTKLSKKYIPNVREKYMCSKHRGFFKKKLIDWKNEIIESNNKAMFDGEMDGNISSPDVVDQAASQTEKSVELKTIARQNKLISKIDKALKKIEENTYGYCEETGDPIGLKRLVARPIATLSIEAQEKHEKNEKIFAQN